MAAVRVFVFALLTCASAAWAEPVTVAGLTFSDELGGFRLLSASGTGTPEDPFVVVEEVTAPEQTVLAIHGTLEAWAGRLAHNRIGSDHPFGYALRKVVINRTDSVWTGYDVELQQPLGQASTQDDGLSFGEGSAYQRYAHADLFRVARVVQKPLDSIAFSVGDVPPGGRIALDFVVTDIQERPAIFLAQRRPWVVSAGE